MAKTLQVNQVADAFVSVPGVSIEMLSQAGAYTDMASATFADVPGLTEVTFEVPVAGTYRVQLDENTASSASGNTPSGVWYQVVFDSAGTPQTFGGEVEEWMTSAPSGSISIEHHVTRSFVVDLTAGSHTVKLQYKRNAGFAGTARSGRWYRVSATLVTGSGAGGIIVEKSLLGSNLLVDTADPTYKDILSITLEAAAGDRFDIHAAVPIFFTAAGAAFCRLDIDGTPTDRLSVQSGAISEYGNGGFCYTTDALTAGSHTIKLQGAYATANWTAMGPGGELSASLHRGGLVPIRQDGASIVDTPRAINFTGGNTTVSNVGGVATVLIEGVTGTTENEPYFADSAGSVVAPTTGAGSFTVGARFSVDKSGAKVAGAFFETAKAGAHTIRVKLWEESNATALASVDVAVSGPGSYEGRFAVPYAIPDADIAKKNFYISMWETSGVNWTEHNPSVYFDQTYVFRGGYTYWTRAKYFVAGDANPEATASGVADYPIDPIVVLPAEGGAVVQAENVPWLQYSSATVVQAVAAPGATSELRVTLNNGQRYKATAPLSADITVSGIGGLDTGSEAADTWYNVFAVPSATAGQFGLVLSTALSSVGPTGFSAWKHVGWVYNGAMDGGSGSDILKFYQTSNSECWWYRRNNVMSVGPGDDASPVTQTLIKHVPPSCSEARLFANAVAGQVRILVDGEAAGSALWWAGDITAAAGDADNAFGSVPTPTSPKVFQYRRQGNPDQAIIYVMGYVDGELSGEVTTYQSADSWQSALDLDFAAEGSQTLSTNTTYTIGGKTWTKFNSANDSVAMAVTNGQGLIMQPVAATDYWVTERSLPGIQTPLTGLIPGVTLTTPLRVWYYIAAHNMTALYDGAVCALEIPADLTAYWQRKLFHSASLKLNASSHSASTNHGEILTANLASKDVLVMEFPNGILANEVQFLAGDYSGGWPAFSALTSFALRPSGANIANREVIKTIADWVLMLGAFRANSATALSVTIGRVKVEYAG